MSLESMLAYALNRTRTQRTRGSGLYLGTSQALVGGESTPFYVPWEPPMHSFWLGRTGSGKTTGLMRIQAEKLKRGLPFLNNDYHGRMTDVLLGLAEAATAKSLLLEPWSDRPVGWNLLEARGDSRYATVQELLAALKCRWGDSWGPRMEELLRMTLLALSEAGLTLVEATPFLSRPDFRQAVLRHVSIQDVREFWSLRFERLSPSQRSAITEPVLNKISVFGGDPLLRCLVGQQQSALDFDEALADGYSLFNNFSSGKLRGNNFLAAALLMPAFRSAVYRRGPDARPYSVFLDEFQEMIANEFLDDYLRSFRKFGCSVYLATQHLDLAPSLKAAIFGNCTRFICFATSAADAAFLGREFGGAEGELVAQLLPELKTGQAIVKVRGEPARLLRVDPVSPPSKELIARGRATCLRHRKSRKEIEAEIDERRRRFTSRSRVDESIEHKEIQNSMDGELPEGYEVF